MVPTRIVAGIVLLGALSAVPALADDSDRNRRRGDRRDDRTDERRAGREGSHAVRRESQTRRSHEGRHRDEARRDDDRRRVYVRPSYADRGHHRSRTVIVPRIVRHRVVTVVPYRPYHYRPRIGLSLYYGSGGSYPYGHTPRGYYDPIAGHAYGGVRITDAPRNAQVFADGYYVGIVDDFDGVFQHVNLEAGEHRLEIQEPGFERIAFDVLVQPGRTITLRADPY